jgi:hypothetical protein
LNNYQCQGQIRHSNGQLTLLKSASFNDTDADVEAFQYVVVAAQDQSFHFLSGQTCR